MAESFDASLFLTLLENSCLSSLLDLFELFHFHLFRFHSLIKTKIIKQFLGFLDFLLLFFVLVSILESFFLGLFVRLQIVIVSLFDGLIVLSRHQQPII